MNNIRITDVRLMRLDPYRTSGKPGSFGWYLIRVDTNQDVWGLGEAYFGPGIREIIDGLLKPRIIGENPCNVVKLFTKMYYGIVGVHTYTGLVRSVISGIDIALWDLAGKITGLPLYQLLGGKFRDRIRLYRVGEPPCSPLDIACCREWAAHLKSEGWTAAKCGGWGSSIGMHDPHFKEPGHEELQYHLSLEDLARVDKSMANWRLALGEYFDIAFHLHGQLDLTDSMKLAKTLEPYRPLWLEDPMPANFSPAWIQLTQSTQVPIATGEDLYSKYEFQPFIEQHGLDILHIDVPKVAGLFEIKSIAESAETHYLPISFHASGSPISRFAAVHLAASIRNFGMMEAPGLSMKEWNDLVIHEDPIILNGYMRVPEGPGLGVELNTDMVKSILWPGERYWE